MEVGKVTHFCSQHSPASQLAPLQSWTLVYPSEMTSRPAHPFARWFCIPPAHAVQWGVRGGLPPLHFGAKAPNVTGSWHHPLGWTQPDMEVLCMPHSGAHPHCAHLHGTQAVGPVSLSLASLCVLREGAGWGTGSCFPVVPGAGDIFPPPILVYTPGISQERLSANHPALL